MRYLCNYCEISHSGYYKHVNKEIKEELVKGLIVDIIQEERRHQQYIRGKKLYHLYKEIIHKIVSGSGRDKFFDILREYELLVERKRSYTHTTNSYHHFHKYKNLIKGLNIKHSNQVWVSDITYLRVVSKFAYLSLITDKYSRKIKGWDLSESLSIEGSIKTLKRVLSSCKCTEGVIHHSDRREQNCSTPTQKY